MQRIMARLLIVVATALLFSVGGAAIFAAPLSVPLLAYMIWRNIVGRGWRILATITLVLTLTQCAWALTHVAVGESKPWIWLLPSTVFVATTVMSVIVASRVPPDVGN